MVYSFTGYKSRSFKVRRPRELSVVLIKDLPSPDDVVVVGYGTQKRENVVGSVSQVSGDVIRRNMPGSSHDLSDALVGTLPGLNVIHKAP